MLRFVSAGESHGRCLTGILEGLPSGLPVDTEFINRELHRRQLGYGRGRRMQIETDRISITAGVRHGKSLGGPIAFQIDNKDWEKWTTAMSVEPVAEGAAIRAVTRPRPGHVDLAGALKYGTHDVRDVLERASARETAARVAAAGFCKLLLLHFHIRIGSHVLAVGSVRVPPEVESLDIGGVLALDPESPMRCADPDAEGRMIELVEKTAQAGDTVGGVVEVVAGPVPPGLGSHTQWDRKLDGRLAQALMCIPAVKAVEIGDGIGSAFRSGSAVHDEIFYDVDAKQFRRGSNNSGGVEGGISNGSDVRARIYVKPIPTLRKPLKSVDLITKEPSEAAFERSDTCVVPAAGVVGEAMLAIVIAQAFLEKFGGDSLAEVEANFVNFQSMLARF